MIGMDTPPVTSGWRMCSGAYGERTVGHHPLFGGLAGGGLGGRRGGQHGGNGGAEVVKVGELGKVNLGAMQDARVVVGQGGHIDAEGVGTICIGRHVICSRLSWCVWFDFLQ